MKASTSTPIALTPKQETFALLVAQGLPASRAYVQAGYSNSSKGVVEANSSRLLNKNAKVKARVAGLREAATARTEPGCLMTIEEKRRMLAEMAKDEKAPIPHRVRALELDSRLGNHFSQDENEIDLGPKSIDAIKEIAARVRSVSPLLLHKMTVAGRS